MLEDIPVLLLENSKLLNGICIRTLLQSPSKIDCGFSQLVIASDSTDYRLPKINLNFMKSVQKSCLVFTEYLTRILLYFSVKSTSTW